MDRILPRTGIPYLSYTGRISCQRYHSRVDRSNLVASTTSIKYVMPLMWRSESRRRQMHRTTYLVLQLLISTMLLVSSSYYKTSAFNDSLYSHDAVAKKLANKHLFMIGDSLMRYQYLTLVHSLKFEKTLVDNGGRNSFIGEGS